MGTAFKGNKLCNVVMLILRVWVEVSCSVMVEKPSLLKKALLNQPMFGFSGLKWSPRLVCWLVLVRF